MKGSTNVLSDISQILVSLHFLMHWWRLQRLKHHKVGHPDIVQGLLNRWTSQLDLGCTTGGVTFNLNNGTKSHLIIVKLLENTFLGMTKVRDWPILTLAMLSVKTEQIQNFALFWDCCRRPKSVISGNLSKNTHVWATQWTTSSELKVKFDPSLDRS